MKLQNRVLSTFKAWEDQKTELQPLVKSGAADARTLDTLQLSHLRKAKHRLENTLREDERPFMPLLSNHIDRLEKKLYPNTLQRWFNKLKDYFFDGPAYLRKQEQQRNINMESMKSQLRDAGLSSVAGRLEKHLDPDLQQVRLPLDCQINAEKKLNINLHFEKDALGDFQLVRLGGSLFQNGQQSKAHEFELSDWPGLASNHVLSLLEGRALKQHYTDATGYQNERWVELGAKGVQHYAPEHDFDIATAVAAMPNITSNRDELTRYLENGQQIHTYWKQDGQFQNISVQADPANRTLKLFDNKGQVVTAEQLGQNAKKMAAAKKPAIADTQKKKGQKNGQRI